MWKNVRCTARCTVCFNIFLRNLSLSSAAVRKITLEFDIYRFLNSDLYRILKHKILIEVLRAPDKLRFFAKH